jgi:hypothetical protein
MYFWNSFPGCECRDPDALTRRVSGRSLGLDGGIWLAARSGIDVYADSLFLLERRSFLLFQKEFDIS